MTPAKLETAAPLPLPFARGELDTRPLLEAVVDARLRGGDVAELARAFHRGLADGVRQAIVALGETHGVSTVVLSGGVFQNELLLEDLRELLAPTPFALWSNREVPANDGGISLGQAALGARRGGEEGG